MFYYTDPRIDTFIAAKGGTPTGRANNEGAKLKRRNKRKLIKKQRKQQRAKK